NTAGYCRIAWDGAYHKPPPGTARHKAAGYVVTGSSGQTGGGPLNRPPMFVSLNTLGSLVLDVSGQQIDAKFLDSGGARRDYFTLVKGPLAPPGADFSAAPTTGVAPLAVQFTDHTSNPPT